MDVREKLNILSAAAKYDVSCTSSGSRRSAPPRGLGDACPAGICHTWSSDGRCISLLKVLLSNACKYDCAYCANRRSNDIPRATFTPKEVIDLTLEFYRRNYIEGLFLSSAVVGSPDATMERLVRVAKELRTVHRFGGYIHLKSIPGASESLLHEAGLYADRFPGNIAFLIGSAYGIDENLKKTADLLLSLSPLTFTHDHARVIMAEQLYRVQMVMQNHPYHHR